MPSFCTAAAIGLTGNPTIPNMNLTPCRLRLLATKVAPSTSLMSALLSERDHSASGPRPTTVPALKSEVCCEHDTTVEMECRLLPAIWVMLRAFNGADRLPAFGRLLAEMPADA